LNPAPAFTVSQGNSTDPTALAQFGIYAGYQALRISGWNWNKGNRDEIGVFIPVIDTLHGGRTTKVLLQKGRAIVPRS